MSWRDSYQPGSYRGVAFLTSEHTREGGRRGEAHEFPERDTPWFEDLGRTARRYSIEALIVGADYFGDRDALVEALEKKGGGELLHPYFGALTVAVESYELRESTAEGGQANFSIEFVEAGEIVEAEAGADTASVAIAAADRIQVEAPLRFANEFDVGGVPGFVEAAAVDNTRSFAAVADDTAQTLAPAGEALRTFVATVDLLTGSAIDLVRAPAMLASTIVDTVRMFASFGAAPIARLGRLRSLLDAVSAPAPVIGTTPVRACERANQDAFVDLVIALVAAELVRAAAEAEFSSYDEATTVRDAVSEQIDGYAVAAADRGRDDAADALDQLRRVLVRDITARGGSLARLYGYVPAVTEPAIVIAHRLYDQLDVVIDRATDMAVRNRLVHPGFVPGGRALEVRTDG